MQKTKFFHYLDMFQVVALGFSFMLADQIYYFNISRPAKFMLSFFKLSSRVKEFKFGLHEVKHESGESYIPKAIENDLIGICNDIENKILRKNSFIREFGSFFDAEKIIMYFRKMCCRKIEGVIILMSVIVWYRRKSQKDQVVPVEFYVEKSPFYSVLKEFALSEYGITVRPLLPFKTIADHFYLVIGNVYILMRASVKPIIRALKKKKKSGHQSENSATPMIANLYTLNGFTFDLTKRCDFPWLLTADIPGGQLLTFFERADVPVTGEMVDAMRKRGIRNMARLKSEKFTSELPIYEVTLIYCRTAFKYMTKTIALVLKELAKLRPTSFVYLGWAMRFIRTYSLEYDFYITNNIIINIDYVDIDPLRIARHVALEAAGGVSMSYQVSAWPLPSPLCGSCADIMFLFGPYFYEKYLRSGGFCNNSIIYNGYLSDYSFNPAKENAEKLRQSLAKKGAKFIICYFDENSSDSKMSLIPNNRSSFIYKKLFDMIINDNNIGLICSPKRPKTLTERLPEIKDLMAKAKDTGRCIFMPGEYFTDNYPNEPAQAADLVISLLVGGTASLESVLAGSRVVYLDLEGFHSLPEYHFGKGKIVFDDLDELIEAIYKFRNNKELFNDFGNRDLVTALSRKDPFQDGMAAQRMGQYINWLLQKFNAGASREAALLYADEQYRKQWGAANVLKGDVKVCAK